MPFIGTRYMYRRQGMCRRLLNAIESALSSLNVELLVIPAVSEVRETWTSVFGFEPLELTNKQIIKNMNLLVFPHVDMLQKKISKHKFADENLIPAEVSNLQKNRTTHKVATNCDEYNSSGTDLIISAVIPSSNACQMNDKTMSMESGCRLPNGLLNNSPDITSKTINHNKCPRDVTCQIVCLTAHDNLAMEDKSTANALDYVSDQTANALDNLAMEDKSPANALDYVSDQTENFPNEIKLAYEIFAKKNRADNIHQDSHKISDSCELRSNPDCVQPYLIGSKEVLAESVNDCGSGSGPYSHCAWGEAVFPTNNLMHLRAQNITEDLLVNCGKNSSVVNVLNADEAEVCSAKTPNLRTNINSGECQSIRVSSGFCEKIADVVNERSKVSSVAEANSLPVDKPWMRGPSELAKPDVRVGQTSRSNAPPLCSSNTASGVALHWASAGGASYGSA